MLGRVASTATAGGKTTGKEGKRSRAHSGLVGGLSQLGEALESVGQRWRSPAPEVEDECEGGFTRRPAMRG